MKLLFVFSLCVFSLFGTGQTPTSSENWQTYSNTSDILIEFKSLDTVVRNREMSLIVFRISNSSSNSKQITYNREIYRDDVCVNCNSSYQEDNVQSVLLGPNQVISGEESLLDNKALYLFNQFKVKVPGMVAKPISSFELIDIQITSN